jgi:hypothetical protein
MIAHERIELTTNAYDTVRITPLQSDPLHYDTPQLNPFRPPVHATHALLGF